MSDEEDWPEYTGVLHEKVLISEDYILELYKDGNHSFEEIIWNKITNARAEKMNALFSLYNIDQDDPRGARKLVANLAVRHIPGFQLDTSKNPRLADSQADSSNYLHFPGR